MALSKITSKSIEDGIISADDLAAGSVSGAKLATPLDLSATVITAPKIANGGFIADANGNEQIKFTTTASAVNELTVTNNATGSDPIISATGGDTNIGIALTPKGTGGIVLPAGAVGTPALTTSGDPNTGIFFPSADTIAFTEGGTEAMRINSDGNLALVKNIGLGGATPTTSGTGITFPASQSASTDANTLDDYEEGTWTPAFTNLTINSGTPIFGGNYTKIGRLVHINWSISPTTTYNITITADSTHINNLPFSVGSSSGVFIPIGTINGLNGMVTAGTLAYSSSTLSNTTQPFVGTLVCTT